MSHPSALPYSSKASHTLQLCSTSSCRAAHQAQPLSGAIPSACSPPQLPQAPLAPVLVTQAGPQQCSWVPSLARLEGLSQWAPSLSEGFPAGEKPSDLSVPLNNDCSHSQQSIFLHLQTCSGPGHSQAVANSWAALKRNMGGTASLLTSLCPLSAGTAPGGKAGKHRGCLPAANLQFAGMHPTCRLLGWQCWGTVTTLFARHQSQKKLRPQHRHRGWVQVCPYVSVWCAEKQSPVPTVKLSGRSWQMQGMQGASCSLGRRVPSRHQTEGHGAARL